MLYSGPSMLDINGEQSRWVTCLQRLQSDNYWALKSSSPWIDLSTSHGQSLAHPWLWCTGILFSGVWISLVLNLCRFEGPEPISVHMLLNACANCLLDNFIFAMLSWARSWTNCNIYQQLQFPSEYMNLFDMLCLTLGMIQHHVSSNSIL